MRLRSYIALEVLSGLVLITGLASGGVWAANFWDSGVTDEAQASSPVTATTIIAPVTSEKTLLALNAHQSDPAIEMKVDVAVDAGVTPSLAGTFKGGTFNGIGDEELLAPLRDSPVAQVKFNKGGSSISLRIDFENGARAAFKPRQSNWQSVPRREVVAFRIDRMLGIGAVPPAMGRTFKMTELLSTLHPSNSYFRPRLKAEIIQKDGWVVGELSWWIPVIHRAKIDGYDIDSMEGIVSWKRYLQIRRKIPEKYQSLLEQISDMVLFDFLINNPDRWSGGNARVNDDRSILYFMDNTMSFGSNKKGHRKARIYFQRCQKFSRSLVAKLRDLQEADIRAMLALDVAPFDLFLEEDEIIALMSRRKLALEYIDGLIGKYGEEDVLAFP